VLDDPSYAAAARRVRADFARHHAAAEAADLVEELAAAGSARPGGVDRFRMTRRPAVGRRIG
jgi:hypothetical protein